MRKLALALVLVPSVAHAQATLAIELGKTATVDAGIRTGWQCDDPSLVDASFVTLRDHNVWTARGAKLGTTTCRLGTAWYQQPLVLTVHVVPPRRE